jgi:hypothetical protein
MMRPSMRQVLVAALACTAAVGCGDVTNIYEVAPADSGAPNTEETGTEDAMSNNLTDSDACAKVGTSCATQPCCGAADFVPTCISGICRDPADYEAGVEGGSPESSVSEGGTECTEMQFFNLVCATGKCVVPCNDVLCHGDCAYQPTPECITCVESVCGANWPSDRCFEPDSGVPHPGSPM